MTNKTKQRFQSALWANTRRQILMCGLGSIGSWTYLLMARSNDHKFLLIDPDNVESVNMGGQFYDKDTYDQPKPYELSRMVSTFVDPPPKNVPIPDKIEEFSKDPLDYEYVITGFDNMDAREYTYYMWKKNPNRKIFIDGRLAMEMFEIYFVIPGREERYEETLFKSGEAESVLCSAKCTSHFAAMIASYIVHGFNCFLVNENEGSEVYELPFSFYTHGPTWQVEIIN